MSESEEKSRKQTAKKGKKQRSRRNPQLLTHPTDEEMKFCELVANGKSTEDAAVECGWVARLGYLVIKRPRVVKYLEKIKEKVLEARAKKVAKAVALSLDLADDRLAEILQAPRIDGVKIAIRMMREKAKVRAQVKALVEGKKLEETILGPVPQEEDDAPPPADDFAILKAVDLAYKRKGGYSTTTPTPQTPNPLVSVTIQNERVYEPAWIRQQYGINDAADAAVERQLGLGTRASSVPTTISGSAAAPEQEMGTEDTTTGRDS